MKYKPQSKVLKTMKWTVIGGIVGEVVSLAGGYYCYHQLKNSSDFRYKVYNYDSRLIDMYYRANEKFGDGKARQCDYTQWGIKKVDSFEFVHLFGL